ncbi:MAG: flagellar hook assembly protein FlgD [Methylomicrobium sp.]|nr:flagellar hook assembly protein FlgD [Methylomicrobium sp.]
MSINFDTLSSLGIKTVADNPAKKQELGQEQFLKLMTTQLTHQDPTKPMENGDFLGQMAQFSTVSGIQDLQKSFAEFAGSISSNQALQAASLVGRSVLVPGSEGVFSLNDNMKGEVALTGPTDNLIVEFQNRSGVTVKQLNLGRQSAGNVEFEWDGQLNDGTFANPGVYQIKANASIDNKNTALQTYVNAGVNSVTLGNGSSGIQLSLNGLDSVRFNDVRRIF